MSYTTEQRAGDAAQATAQSMSATAAFSEVPSARPARERGGVSGKLQQPAQRGSAWPGRPPARPPARDLEGRAPRTRTERRSEQQEARERQAAARAMSLLPRRGPRALFLP